MLCDLVSDYFASSPLALSSRIALLEPGQPFLVSLSACSPSGSLLVCFHLPEYTTCDFSQSQLRDLVLTEDVPAHL